MIRSLADPKNATQRKGGSVTGSGERDAMRTEVHLRVLRALEANPEISQRQLASLLGISLGKTHYCLHSLISAGWIKALHFRNRNSKIAYAYCLTAKGLDHRASLTVKFLQRKRVEFELLKREIADLDKELKRLKQ